jgi:hypothetical protein
MAARRLWTASSLVRPWPFARGTYGQNATNRSSSRSMTAVNSFRIGASRRDAEPQARPRRGLGVEADRPGRLTPPRGACPNLNC